MRYYRRAVGAAVLYVLIAAIGDHLPPSWPPWKGIAGRLAGVLLLFVGFHLYSRWMSHRPGGASLTDRRLFLAAALDLLAAALHPRPADALNARILRISAKEPYDGRP